MEQDCVVIDAKIFKSGNLKGSLNLFDKAAVKF